MKPKLIKIPHDQANKTAQGLSIKINDSLFVLICDKKDELIDSLREGDVIHFGKNDRTILGIRSKNGRLFSIYLASLRGNDFTIYFRADTKQKFVKVVSRASPGWPKAEDYNKFGIAIQKVKRRKRNTVETDLELFIVEE